MVDFILSLSLSLSLWIQGILKDLRLFLKNKRVLFLMFFFPMWNPLCPKWT